MCLDLKQKSIVDQKIINYQALRRENEFKQNDEQLLTTRIKHDRIYRDEYVDSLIQSNNEELQLNQEELSMITKNLDANQGNYNKLLERKKHYNEKEKKSETTNNYYNFIINEYISINKDIDAIPSTSSKLVKYLHKKRLDERGYRMTNKKLGEGGYGAVYKIYARNSALTKPLACKIMLLSRKDKSTALENYSNEIFAMKCSEHVNLISIKDNFIYSHALSTENILMTHSYIIMEYAELGTLWAKLKKNGPFDEEASKGYFRQISNGLLHLHLQGIAHRDLKLGNILLTSSEKCQEVVKLADFGLSRLVNSKESGLLRFSKPAGTLAYMSPQILACYISSNTHQKLTMHTYDPFKADLWALGVCLYLFLTKMHPFDNPPPNKAERVLFAKKMLEKQMRKEWVMPTINTDRTPNDSYWYVFLLNRLFEPVGHKRLTIYDVIKNLDFNADKIK